MRPARGKLASQNTGTAKARLFSKNKSAVHGNAEGGASLQLAPLGIKDDDDPTLQFPVWPEVGIQQQTLPQFNLQGLALCRKLLTSAGAVSVTTKINGNQPVKNLFRKNAMNAFRAETILKDNLSHFKSNKILRLKIKNGARILDEAPFHSKKSYPIQIFIAAQF